MHVYDDEIIINNGLHSVLIQTQGHKPKWFRTIALKYLISRVRMPAIFSSSTTENL